MSRFSRKSDNPPVQPVKKIEVSDKHRKAKMIAIVVLLALGVTLIVTAVVKALTTPPGWAEITVNATAEESCGAEFVFQYPLGEGDKAANVEQRELTELYTQATKEAFQFFHAQKTFEGVKNLAYLNQHPNEEVEVPAALYNALSAMERHENRSLYLAPLYREYVKLFLSDEDWAAEEYHPQKDADQAAYFAEVLAFTTQEDEVKLELLGNNRVKLSVSDKYLQYAAAHQITEFVDFYWMKNAFITDYLAETLLDAGYTKGTITSFDGFSRNLDNSDRAYRMNIFDRVGVDIYLAGALEYSGATAFVSLRNYPMSDLAVDLYYGWKDGSFTSCHIDPADGKDKAAIHDLMGYSKTLSCAELLLQLAPVYVSEVLDTAALQSLQGIDVVYTQNYTIHATQEGAKIVDLHVKDNIAYRVG